MTTADETQVEAAIVNEILNRQWATKQQIRATQESIDAQRIKGPIHRALAEQRLLKPTQVEKLEEFYHKDLQIDRFKVIRKLGAGAMGDVFLAEDDTGTRAAIKVISKRFADDHNFLKRFEREIEALAALHHEHIANAIAFGRHNGLPYLAMQYIDGPSLAQLMDKHGPLPEPYVLRIGMQIAAGLDYVFNETQLVHRDLKPENILVMPEPDGDKDNLFNRQDSAYLIDFGLARSFADSERLTMTGITMGTPHYMSPEQIRGSQELDIRSDVYGLGATMFHLLCGRTPYAGTSPGAVMTAHLTEPVPDPKQYVPGLSDGTRSVVVTCMQKAAKDRYATVGAMITACEKAIESLGSSGMRLVRRPLVLNKPKKPAASDKTPVSPLSTATTPPPPPAAEPMPEPAVNDSGIALPNLVDPEERAREAEQAAKAAAEAEAAKAKAAAQQAAAQQVASQPDRTPDVPLELPDNAGLRTRMMAKAKQIREDSGRSDVLPDDASPPTASPPAEAAGSVALNLHYPSDPETSTIDEINIDGLVESEEIADEPASEALRKLQTDRIRAKGGNANATTSARPKKKPATRAPLVHASAGPGMIPMVILCFSVVVLLAVILFNYVM